ncbi:hypothetical protein PV327_003748 [Microctonus hyperodae]|uniref:Rad21/Rec8-like protein N-terminal domain-containing protein n=1 Tax=Microctonus hyperodae TaxID=165561 RepID=A0AA39G4N4_MICHY|nr:hypothetical protein PV327_003748 [Microctonus hyperodae]
MYYIPELLNRRNEGRMSRCWFAATLNENNFKKIFKSKDLINFDIELASEDIVNVLNRKHGTALRFSLYLSSQLVLGLTKIQLYKINNLEELIKKLQTALRPVDLKKLLQKKEKKLEIITDLPSNVPEPIDIVQYFTEQVEKPDCHQILDEGQYDAFFSDIQDDEFEEREFDILCTDDLDIRFKECFPNEAEVMDETRERLNETPEVIRQPLVDLHTMNLPGGNVSRTPSKRKGREIDANTPSKRHRRNLLFSLENQENVPPTMIPNVDESNNLQRNMDNDPPIPSPDASNIQPFGQTYSLIDDVSNPDVPAERPLDTLSTTISSNLFLEPLVLSEIPPRRKRKPRKLIIDQINRISSSEMQSRTANINIMTHLRDIVDIDRIRFDSQLLFTKPSTSRRGPLIIDCSNKLQSLFKLDINHRFHIDYDESLFPEKIRHREINENTVELSSGDARRQEQTNEISAKDISHPIANIDEIIPHGEIEREPLNDIEEACTVMEPTVPSELITIGDQTSPIPTDDTVPVRDSTKSNTDFSSLLPENYEKSSLHKQSSSAVEKIIDISISKSPSYLIILESVYNDLKCRWSEKNRPIDYEDLFVPEEITESQIACTLLSLLHLVKNRLILLEQSAPYATIWIYSA